MSNDPGSVPPPPPPPPPSLPPSSPVNPAEAVKMPAIGLMAAAGIGILWQLGVLLLRILGTAGSAMEGREGIGGMMTGSIGIVFSIIGLIVAGVIIFGAMKMQKLQSYNLAMGVSIVAMIPCISPCCVLGLPIGIWALITLMKPEVKAAFVG